jgi:hypothetical protein
MRNVREAFGGDFWPYGLTANRPTLDAFMRYAASAGFITTPVPDIAKLFGHVEEFVDKY